MPTGLPYRHWVPSSTRLRYLIVLRDAGLGQHRPGDGRLYSVSPAFWELARIGPKLLVEGQGGACHLRQAAGLPVIAGRVAGAPGSSRLLPIRPAPPDVTRLPR
jgi:hypothetical protein